MLKKEVTIEEIIVSAIISIFVTIISVVGIFYVVFKYGTIPWFFIIMALAFLICSIICMFWWMDLKEFPEAIEERKKEIEKNISLYKISSTVMMMLFIFISIGFIYYFIFSSF